MSLYNSPMVSLVLAIVAFVTFQVDPAARAREVLSAIAAKDFAKVEAQFNEKVKAAMPPGRLEIMWTTLQLQAGVYKSCDSAAARVVTIGDKNMVITPCDFDRAKVNVQFAFDGEGKIAGMTYRPAAAPAVRETPVVPYSLPSYAVPSSYTESDLTVGAGGDWPLPGTLTLPTGDGPFPAVVIVHGSGAGDRDGTVVANKPYKDLALGLASKGVAVLRYDKRLTVHGPKMAARPGMTVKDETIDDAIAALALVRAQPKIDAGRVFVLGHSLGGTLVPRIAAADPKLAGAIVMAGAARPLEDAILAQMKHVANADGTVSPEEQRNIDDFGKIAAAIKALTPADAASETLIVNAPPSYWLDLKGYDAPAAAKTIGVPLLVLQGERDFQVTMEDFARWNAALSGRPRVTFKSYPGLNHLFIAGTGTSLPAEYETPSHVAQQVVGDIAAWVTAPRR
jgi:dienelactone hydrolase